MKIKLDPKLTIKDIHDNLWRGRDFELSHLWQRSIFLTAFLVLCFSGYGALVIKMLERNTTPIAYYNSIGIIICTIGLIFSVMWIMMAKASKAWYEVYEKAITAFERNSDYGDRITAKIGGFQEPQIPGYDELEFNDSIFNGQGGAYSPSRINIAIGQVTFCIWLLAFMGHLFIFIYRISDYSFMDWIKQNCDVILLVLSIIFILFFVLCVVCKGWLRSNTLKKKESWSKKSYKTYLMKLLIKEDFRDNNYIVKILSREVVKSENFDK